MTWHQWHQTAPMSSRMGLSSAWARANAASPHGVPLDRLMARRTQVGGGRVVQAD